MEENGDLSPLYQVTIHSLYMVRGNLTNYTKCTSTCSSCTCISNCTMLAMTKKKHNYFKSGIG